MKDSIKCKFLGCMRPCDMDKTEYQNIFDQMLQIDDTQYLNGKIILLQLNSKNQEKTTLTLCHSIKMSNI